MKFELSKDFPLSKVLDMPSNNSAEKVSVFQRTFISK